MDKRITAFLLSLRYQDIVVFEAPTLVGMAFSMPDLSPGALTRAGLVAFGSFLLMAHIFCFNDWSDSASDAQISEKSGDSHLQRGVSRPQMLALSLGLGAGSLLIFAAISATLAVLAAAILGLSLLYSFPHSRFKGKGIPLWSSMLHVAGTVLAFLLGYAGFSAIDLRALLIGAYFALLLTAGHLVQEVQDHAGDQQTRISTNAVQFGPSAIFYSALAIFVASFIYLFILAQTGVIPLVLKYLVVGLPVLAGMGMQAARAGLGREELRRFRGRYRILFGMLVISMAAATILIQ